MGLNETPNKLLLDKYDQVLEYLKSMESVAVAFSGGVDSTFNYRGEASDGRQSRAASFRFGI